MSTKAEQLEWRRTKIIEMKAKGMNHSEIARELQVARTSVVADVQYLRSKARESIKEYVTHHLPEQYTVCITALDSIIKDAYEIKESSGDNREKLQALELFKTTHLEKLELLSDAHVIDHALQFIKNNNNNNNDNAKGKTKKNESVDDADAEETTTTTTTEVI